VLLTYPIGNQQKQLKICLVPLSGI